LGKLDRQESHPEARKINLFNRGALRSKGEVPVRKALIIDGGNCSGGPTILHPEHERVRKMEWELVKGEDVGGGKTSQAGG